MDNRGIVRNIVSEVHLDGGENKIVGPENDGPQLGRKIAFTRNRLISGQALTFHPHHALIHTDVNPSRMAYLVSPAMPLAFIFAIRFCRWVSMVLMLKYRLLAI